MSSILELPHISVTVRARQPRDLASSITWSASKQTYFTIRLLADRDRMHDAYRAYAYFRWVDDTLDQGGLDLHGRTAFVERQHMLIERCYRKDWPEYVSVEEQLLVSLIRSDTEPNSGLQAYIRAMLAVMDFDARRRGRLVSAMELNQYTYWLAVAVTEAMHHFIGHGSRSPRGEARYRAVMAAHITHMLRDTLEDIEAGYYNIPHEAVEATGIDPDDVSSAAYRSWVMCRVSLARSLFKQACAYLDQVESLRYRLAACAYIARFEVVLDAVERDDYQLCAAYPERRRLAAMVRMGRSVIHRALSQRRPRNLPHALSMR
jgi:hypothetical protein